MTNARINEIDLLRFLAALSVVLFHYAFRGYASDGLSVLGYPPLAPFAKYGYLGVDLFFMISGFVILMTAANANIKSFLVSRIVRLYPAFWACCTITFLTTLAIGRNHFSAFVWQYLENMVALGSAFSRGPIDGAYWSLAVEIQFYVLVAIVLIARKIHQTQFLLALWLAGTVLVDLFPFTKLQNFLVVDYSGFFIAGAACFLIWSQGLSLERIGLLLASWYLTLYQAIGVLPDFEYHYHTSMNCYVVAIVVTAFFGVMLLISLRLTGAFGKRRWLRLGAMSYPLYLVHQNVGFMIFNVASAAINRQLLFWGTILLSIGIAFLVHTLIEKRFASGLNRVLDSLDRVSLPTKNEYLAERVNPSKEKKR